jgi:hypothetical protein
MQTYCSAPTRLASVWDARTMRGVALLILGVAIEDADRSVDILRAQATAVAVRKCVIARCQTGHHVRFVAQHCARRS